MKGLTLNTDSGKIYIPPFNVEYVGHIYSVPDAYAFDIGYGLEVVTIGLPTREEIEHQHELITEVVKSWYIDHHNEDKPHDVLNLNTQISHLRSRRVVHFLH